MKKNPDHEARASQEEMEKLEKEFLDKMNKLRRDMESFLSLDEAIWAYLKEFESAEEPDTGPQDKGS